jgi:GNAT superfamily N-acetyltransferase
MTTVRPGTPDDAAAYLDLRRGIYPWLVHTAAAVRHQWRSELGPAKGALFAVDDPRGGLAGFGSGGLSFWSSEEGAAHISVAVHPAHRGRGVGGALLTAVEEHLRSVGVRRAQAFALDDPACLEWVRNRGYDVKAEVRYSRAPLAGLPPAPPVGDGVTLLPFEAAAVEEVFLVDSESVVDEPGEVTIDKMEYAEWVRDIWEGPALRRDLSVIAFVDGAPASATFVEADPDTGRVWSGGTGTRREFRGRGLAKAVKSAALRRARDAGLTDAYTSNDEVNAPMLAVNEWLGYRPVGAQWECIKDLSGS